MKNSILSSILVFGIIFTAGCGLSNSDSRTKSSDFSNNNLVSGEEVLLNNNALGSDELAQSFTTGASITTLSSVTLTLKKSSNLPAHQLTVAIQEDLGGRPDNLTIVDGSRAISMLGDNTTSQLTFPLATTITLTQNTKYWIRLSSSGLPRANPNQPHIAWAGRKAGTYSFGESLYKAFTANNWSNAEIPGANFGGAAHDFSFRLDN